MDKFAGVSEPVMFVDQFTQEYSRDVEPMRGGHWDNYYYQMVDFIRRYKGVREVPQAGPPFSIVVDGRFEDWREVGPEYRDDIGDTMDRDHPGWGSAGPYVDCTGRNDIVSAKVTRDVDYLYFYARTRAPITPHTDPHWMMLYIDADCDPKTGWEGYDCVVNRRVRDGGVALLERWEDGKWASVGGVAYRISGRELELAVRRSALGLEEASPVRFDFKWVDNVPPGDVMAFTERGDSAPNGRFRYRYRE